MRAVARIGLSLVGLVAASANLIAADSKVAVELVPFSQAEQEAFVKAHNEARKAVGTSPLEWSDDLASYSAEWLKAQSDKAKEQAEEGQLPNPGHRPHEGQYAQKYGENLAVWGGTARIISNDPVQAVRGWLREEPAFKKLNEQKPYVTGDEQSKTDSLGNPIVVGHYTQLVWKGTKRVGASRLIITVAGENGQADRKYVVVTANYDPPGNVLGEKPF